MNEEIYTGADGKVIARSPAPIRPYPKGTVAIFVHEDDEEPPKRERKKK